jgi:hypothetical protein
MTTDTVRLIDLLFFASCRGGSDPPCRAGNDDPTRSARVIQHSCLANQFRFATAQYHAKMALLFSTETAES